MVRTVRLSIGAFNTEEHIDKAIEAVKQIAAFERKTVNNKENAERI